MNLQIIIFLSRSIMATMTSSHLLDYRLSHLAILFSFDFMSAAEVFSISLQHGQNTPS
jgi:hypothetical protein